MVRRRVILLATRPRGRVRRYRAMPRSGRGCRRAATGSAPARKCERGNRQAPPAPCRQDLPRHGRQGADRQPREHPHRQHLVPNRQAKKKETRGQPESVRRAVELHQQQQAGADQQVLEGHRAPVESRRQQVLGIGGQNDASNHGGAGAHGRAQEAVEDPDAGGSGQQGGEAQGPYAGAPNEKWAPDPRLERAQVAHVHQRNAGVAEVPGVIPGLGLIERGGRQRLIRFDAEAADKGHSRKQEENRRGGGANSFASFGLRVQHMPSPETWDSCQDELNIVGRRSAPFSDGLAHLRVGVY
jgi:hypothetical protein